MKLFSLVILQFFTLMGFSLFHLSAGNNLQVSAPHSNLTLAYGQRDSAKDDCGCYGYYCPSDQVCSCEVPESCDESKTDGDRKDHDESASGISNCRPRPECHPEKTPCCVGDNCNSGCGIYETCVYKQLICIQAPCCLVPNCVRGVTGACTLFCVSGKVCKPFQHAVCNSGSCVVYKCIDSGSCPIV